MRRLAAAAALLCRSLAWFPLWQLAFSLRPPDAPLLCMGWLALCCGLAAAGAGWLLRGRFRRLTLAFRLTAALLCAAGLWALGCGIWLPVLLAGVSVLSASRGMEQPPAQLFTPGQYGFFLTGITLSAILLRLSGSPVPMARLLCCACAVSGLFLLLRNQSMLHRMVNRRSRDELAVPRDIARTNLYLVAGVVVLLFAVLLLHRPFAAGMRLLGKGAVLVIRGILRGLTRLVALLAGNAPAEPVPLPEAPGDPAAAEHPGSPLWNLLLLPLIPIAVYMWKHLLSDWVDTFRGWVFALYQRMHRSGTPAARPDAPAEYTDTETVVDRAPSQHRREKQWKRAFRQWRSLPENDEKFYAGYRLMLDAPAWETPPAPAATPAEIRAAWGSRHPDSLQAITEHYHTARYAERPLPAQSNTDMQQALRLLEQTRKEKTP